VQVIEEPFEDAGEQDAKGLYDYYYSGVVYRLVELNRSAVVGCGTLEGGVGCTSGLVALRAGPFLSSPFRS
jgi:hypothetical protein